MKGPGRRSPPRTPAVVIAAVAATLVVAVLVAPFASEEPDGLERVADDEGIAHLEEDHALTRSPLADYGLEGVADDRLSTGLAGVMGVAAILGLTAVGAAVARSRRRAGAGAESTPEQ